MLNLLNKLNDVSNAYWLCKNNISDRCLNMKQHIVEYHSKHWKDYKQMPNEGKFLDTIFHYKDETYYIKIWYFQGEKNNVPLYTLYTNGDKTYFINVESSNHALSKNFLAMMTKSFESHYMSKLFFSFLLNFSENERNELYINLNKIIHSCFNIESLSEQKETFSIANSLNDNKRDIFFKLLIYYYNKNMKNVIVDFFDYEE